MRLLLLILLLVPSLFTASPPRQVASDAPYLYYFDEYLNALVVERADGSDSHILAEDVMPWSFYEISGAGWSPSGEWFAWTAFFSDRDGTATNNRGYSVHVSGDTYLEALDDLIQPLMQWSPTQDYLLVAGWLPGTDLNSEQNPPPVNPVRVSILDAATGRPLTSIDFTTTGIYERRYTGQIQWLQDGAYGLIWDFQIVETAHNFTPFTRFHLLDTYGNIREKTIPGELLADVTENGWIAYSPDWGRSVVLENLITGEQRGIQWMSAHLVNNRFESSVWNESETQLFLRGTAIDLYVDLLTEQVAPIARFFPPELDHLGAKLPAEIEYFGDHAVAIYENTLYQLMPSENQFRAMVSGVWMPVPQCCEDVAYETIQGGRLVLVRFEEPPIVYEVASGSIIAEIPLTGGEHVAGLWLSNDLTWMVGDHSTLPVYNLVTGETRVIRPHAGLSPLAGYPVTAILHPERDWFISGADGCIAGCGEGLHLRGVVHASTGDRRDFVLQCTDLSCINWLPAQVAPPVCRSERLIHNPDTSCMEKTSTLLAYTGVLTDAIWQPG